MNDTESFGAMAEGVEFVSRYITLYELIERLYLEKDTLAKNDLIRAIIIQHAAVLKFLPEAVRFYGRKTAGKLQSQPYQHTVKLQIHRRTIVAKCRSSHRDRCGDP
jgi:hypothetical protein